VHCSIIAVIKRRHSGITVAHGDHNTTILAPK
jgi:hypothetical protein